MSPLAMAFIGGVGFAAACLILPKLFRLVWLIIVMVTPYGIVAGIDFLVRVSRGVNAELKKNAPEPANVNEKP